MNHLTYSSAVKLGISIWLLLAGLLFSLNSCTTSEGQAERPPNIVLIMADDMGFSDLGCYGSEIQTPNLDRLAQEGMRMTQFYNTAKCTETRATLLTGLHFQQTNNLNKSDNNVTIAEALGENGYQTIMAGKWHLGNWAEEVDTPNKRGFNEYFGFLNGASNFYTGRNYKDDVNYMRLNSEVFEAPEDFYTTDAFTDFAMEQISAATQQEKPFFVYLAHNAPHYPLQAPEENIAKYRGSYNIGWDSLRLQRLQRMKELGIVDIDQPLAPRDSLAPAWNDLTTDQQQEEAELMAVYAGMVDRLDEQIGRLLNHLDSLKVAENTLVVFLSDNGGCPFDANHSPIVPPGPEEADRTYDTEWAQVSNTPFRKYKQWIHEGGIATPMIIRWPTKIQPNTKLEEPGQLVDIMPTFLAAAGANYPERYQTRQVLPMEGVSLLPAWQGGQLTRKKPMFWEFRGSRAVREGDWKLVGQRGGSWELYNITEDRAELSNQIDQQPERAQAMMAAYEQWAERVGAHSNEASLAMPLNQQDRYLFEGEKEPNTLNK
ncbi:arylsulfatase [Tunicatimonas pelagia]|uniref:arylsulfatase n=1 Tax=Tunicatimonas pelagia TaxID=931531 RepID=UPI002665EE36|nr:arylsulfatase [Tunicatimonas pelagia]WKN43565.1 arylsulfatase [Tunicatimonas pelagia]